MVFISKQSMPEPIITNFRFSLEPSVTGTNFPQMHFRLKIWTCLKKTLSILPMSCPTITNSYLLSAFILHYTNLVSSLFSPFLTNNTLHLFFLLPHTAYKHLNRWKAIKPETWNLKPDWAQLSAIELEPKSEKTTLYMQHHVCPSIWRLVRGLKLQDTSGQALEHTGHWTQHLHTYTYNIKHGFTTIKAYKTKNENKMHSIVSVTIH